MTDPFAIMAIFAALALGGVLKGAVGLGSPLLAVPLLAAMFDVRTAVVVMVLPNLITNLWQFWTHRQAILGRGMFWRFAVAGAIGAMLGTIVLSQLSGSALSLGVAGALVAFMALRLARPDWRLPPALADRLTVPMGILAGLLQGASGISAPVIVSYFNAMQLDRHVFIAGISLAFIAMSLVQVPLQFSLGLMTPALMGLSLFALIPLLTFMPVGAWLVRTISAASFDRIVLILLGLLTVRLIQSALTG